MRKNKWIDYLRKNKGKGYTIEELRKRYKSKRIPRTPHTSPVTIPNYKDVYMFFKLIGATPEEFDIDIDEFLMGLEEELEHGSKNKLTNITDNDLVLTGKIVLAHLLEDNQYYTKLKRIKGGSIGAKSYKTIMNQIRKRKCGKKCRPLYEGEFHPGFANFEGPGTRIDLPQVRNFPPYNNVDACAKTHDIDYSNAGKYTGIEREKRIRDADNRFLKCIDKYKNEEPYYTIGKLGIETKNRFEDAFPIIMRYAAPSYFGK